MSSYPALSHTIKQNILNFKSISVILIISFFYFSFSVLILNYRLISQTFFYQNPIFYKLDIVFQLLKGSYFSLGPFDFALVVFSSLLVGANMLLLLKILRNLKKEKGRLSLTVGGSAVLGIMVAGSCLCGFSTLSLLGVSGALLFLPLKGLEVHLVVVALLVFSFWYSLKTYHQKVVCKVR